MAAPVITRPAPVRAPVPTRVPRAPAPPRRHGLSLGEGFTAATEALYANKVRSLLTMLGIIIGVAAVIVMIAIGTGAQANVAARLQGLGTNVLQVMGGSIRTGGAQTGAGATHTLVEADVTAILNNVTDVAAVSPQIDSNFQVVANNQNWNTRVAGVYPSYLSINNWQVQAGIFFDDSDEQSGRPVALIGQTVFQNLFPDGNAVGQPIRINNVQFTVVGVLASKGQSGFRDQDDTILVPFKAANERLFHQTYVNDIVIQAASADKVTSVQNQVTELLRERHKIAGGQNQNDFRIFNTNDVIQTAQGVATTMSYLLAGVAAVSLLVGGIGIMNIMLVSVTERTREIGIRMAIGARVSDILMQFLIEAGLLGMVGGVLGIGVGVGGSYLVSRLAGWNSIVTPDSILISFGFATLVGIFFGYYPARRASRLDPIVALRTD